MTIYAMGSYQRAAGTRAAFAGLSSDLVAEGHPPITVNSGDREPEVQEAIFRDKFVPSSGPRDVGPYSDRKYWPGHGWWKRVKGGGTVGVPETSNHEKRRAGDLAYPYNSNTAAHRRAQVLAKRHNITCEGMGFSEWWHWTFWGVLGQIDTPTGSGASASKPAPEIAPEEDEMNVFMMTAEAVAGQGDKRGIRRWLVNPWEKRRREISSEEEQMYKTAGVKALPGLQPLAFVEIFTIAN